MKKAKQKKLPKPVFKWQTGDYERRASFSFLLQHQFLLLCRLTEVTPADIVRDFTDNLACGSWKREGRDEAKVHLINYFIACGYGQHHYTPEELRQMFKELDAVGLLFPETAGDRLLELYSKWRKEHHAWWFKKWFYTARRKPARPLPAQHSLQSTGNLIL